MLLQMALVAAALTALSGGATAAGSTRARLDIDLSKPRVPFDHTWEECIGSGHASLTLRADWREHVAMARRDLGIKRVRFHGILDDDMSTSMGPSASSYVNVDSWADFMREQNMSALVELGFMPRWLSRGRAGLGGFQCEHVLNHYAACVDPPSNFTQWGEVVGSLVAHLVERYGLESVADRWAFEVWNEPNLNGQADPLVPPPSTFAGGGDWWGTGMEYFELYAHAARAVKTVSPRLKVGGPVTTGGAVWVKQFREFCRNNSVPLDFISTHAYPGGDTEINSVASTVRQLAASKAAAGNLPHFVSEWGGSWQHGPVGPEGPGNATTGRCHDDYSAASFVVALVDKAQGLADLLSYWCISDVFEESGFPVANSSFFGGFGVVNIYGVPKPAYRAFQILHEAGSQRFHTAFSGDASCVATLGAVATAPTEGQLHLILYSQAPSGEPIEPMCELEVVVHGALRAAGEGTLRRIDGEHANPMQRWIDLGMPQYPTSEENADILAASALAPEPLRVRPTDGGLSFAVSLPAQGVAAVQLRLLPAGVFV